MKLSRKPKQTPGRRHITTEGNRAPAFSYHASRVEQDYNLGRTQPREQDTRRHEKVVRYWRQRLGMLLAGVVLIICVLDVLHLSSSPSVVALTSSSDNSFLQPTKVYQQAAQKLFASSLLNANKITINTDVIQTKLKQEFPELSDVSITLPLMSHHPIIYVAPTTPSLILKATNGDFVLDNTGKSLVATTEVGDLAKLQLPTVTDQSGLAVHVDENVLPSTSVTFIHSVVAELKAKQVGVDSLTLPSAAYELDLKPTGVGYYVKFNLHTASALQQVGTYLAVRQRLASQNITPSSYIDVRLDGRAYYK